MTTIAALAGVLCSARLAPNGCLSAAVSETWIERHAFAWPLSQRARIPGDASRGAGGPSWPRVGARPRAACAQRSAGDRLRLSQQAAVRCALRPRAQPLVGDR